MQSLFANLYRRLFSTSNPMRRHRLRRSAAHFESLEHRVLLSGFNTAVTRAPPDTAPANPEGGSVVFGQAFITQTSPNTVTINQITDRAIINWQSFNIPNGETVNIIQPGASSAELIRIIGGNPTQILGNLTSNGQVWIVNRNGVFFGKHARVNAAGLIASTAGVSNNNFNTGTDVFDYAGKSDASVINEGDITVAEAGLIALVAPGVKNGGVITATSGTVILGSGNTFTIKPDGPQRYRFTIDKNATQLVQDETGTIMSALIVNNGTLSAQGGAVYMTAGVGKGVVDQAINTAGNVVVSAARVDGGTLVLDGGGGDVRIAGMLDASSMQSGQTGGSIQVLTTGNIALASAKLDASGARGGGEVTIGGVARGQAVTLTNCIINSGGGDITVIGVGGNAAAGKNYGVYVSVNSVINGGGGNITITGTGGNGGGDANYGVYVASNSSINGGGGNIAITGTGGNGTGGSNFGVFVDASTAINGRGGNVSIRGAGGNASGNSNTGIYNRGIVGTSGAGGITVTGTGGGNTNSGDNFGVAVSSGGAFSTENGAINVHGTGGGAGSGTDNFGVYLTKANSTIETTGSGPITITGQAGDLGANATGVYNDGVYIDVGTSVQAGASSNITITGAGGNGANVTTNGGGGSNIGVFNAGLIAGGGAGSNVVVTGNGGKSSRNQNYGIIDDQGTVQNTGTGNVTLIGVAGGCSGNSSFNSGIQLSSGGIFSVADGALIVTGTAGGAGTGSYNIGVYATGANSTIESTGAGTVTINGTGGDMGGSGSSNAGVRTDVCTVIQASTSDNISITGIGGSSTGRGNIGVILKGSITADGGN